MATVTISKRADGIVNVVTGSFTSDGSAQIVSCGFEPVEIQVINETDVILWYKFSPMAAANSIKTVAAGTTTLDTGSGIVINADNTFTISATAAGTAKAIKFVARR